MNMKKTMAAVSAAAVAISAMATTVSAEDTAATTTAAPAGSITYDLVRETKTLDDGSATISTSATGLYIDGAKFILITLENDYLKFADGKYTITVKDATGATNALWVRDFSPKNDADNYSKMITTSVNFDKITFAIPVSDSATDGVSTATYGKLVDVTVVGTVKHEIQKDSIKTLNPTVDTVVAGVSTNKGTDLETDATFAATDAAYATVASASIFDFTAIENALTAVDQWEIANNIDVLPATVTLLAGASGNGNRKIDFIEGTYASYADYVKATGIVEIDGIDAANDLETVNNWLSSVANNDTTALSQIAAATTAPAMWAKYMGATAYEVADATHAGSKIGSLKVVIAIQAQAAETKIKAYKTLVDKYKALVAGSQGVRYTEAALKFSAVTDAGKKVHLWPMLTNINGVCQPTDTVYGTKFTSSYASHTGGWDLIDYLELNDDGLTSEKHVGKVGYHNVLPVLNDILANNSNVTFSFKTSALYVKTTVAETDKEFGEGFVEKKDDYWYNPTFGQHLYNDGFYGAEGSGFVGTGSAWAFNLFTGGLVVNNNTTMALNDTSTFDWGESTLSFDWEDVAGGKVTNASEILYFMNLYTSTNWFWDSFTVTYSNEDVEDVDTTAGAEGDEEVVEEVVETEAVVEEAPVEEAPVEDAAANPTTGNASVALAVIPVALAAAAIVAKKRG